jgi:hypothetical protein
MDGRGDWESMVVFDGWNELGTARGHWPFEMVGAADDVEPIPVTPVFRRV